MLRLALFDLDGTLAENGAPVPDDVRQGLQGLVARGVQVGLCSGKPTYYLAGLVRQLGLEDAILIGETGLSIQYGSDVPPDRFHLHSPSQEDRDLLAALRTELTEHFERIWFQPNEASLTVFYYDTPTKVELRSLLRDRISQAPGLRIFEQLDCFDITPGFTKADGIRVVMADLGLKVDEIAYVGDSENDGPAMELIPLSISVSDRISAPIEVDTIQKAIQEIVLRLKAETL